MGVKHRDPACEEVCSGGVIRQERGRTYGQRENGEHDRVKVCPICPERYPPKLKIPAQ